MHTLTIPRVLHVDRSNYVIVRIEGDDHAFRFPPLQEAALLAQIVAKSWGAWTIAKETSDPTEATRENAKAWRYFCAVLGATWYHPTKDLDSGDWFGCETDADWLRYGRDVNAELTEAGYTQEHLAALFSPVGNRLVEQLLPTKAEVDKTANFTKAPKARPRKRSLI
jgi:hypothetical protein